MLHRCLRAAAALTLAALLPAAPATAQEVAAADVLTTYANIAQAGYEDSYLTALALGEAIGALFAAPSDETLTAARNAWLVSRVPYMQTEAYRFGNAIVDDWEGRVNAWPLDEGLIDYVSASYGTESDPNTLYIANVIANPVMPVNGAEVTVDPITPDAISGVLHEAGGNEANVASGYHAIEFLLWGQDLNGTGPGAGARPATDFDLAACTGGNCERRRAYLKAASDLLVADLEEMVGNWTEEGAARLALTQGDPDQGIAAILTGMGSLSYGELAGERMKLGLLLHDPEEEHDCFSDNTHNSHYFDAAGIQNVYLGTYVRMDGTLIEGPSLSEYVAQVDPALDRELRSKLGITMARMRILVARAESGEAFDQMIGEGNEAGNSIVQAAIDGLVNQTHSIERIVDALGLAQVTIEGSDSLDSPDAVFQ
ncbi:MAG: imelysin family protein [Cucumibacter sp.]